MLDYIRGEFYRLLRKKSLYFFLGILAALYLLLCLARMGNASESRMLDDAGTLFALLPAVVGGYLFAALYTDDLQARNLATLIGFGMGKAKIVLSKLILVTLACTFVFALVPPYMGAALALSGSSPTAEAFGFVYVLALKSVLATIAFSSLSAIVVYGLQRATFGMVAYVLLALGLVSQLLSALLEWEMVSRVVPGLATHLMSGITLRIQLGLLSGDAVLLPAVEYTVYVAATAALSILAFRKKELEF